MAGSYPSYKELFSALFQFAKTPPLAQDEDRFFCTQCNKVFPNFALAATPREHEEACNWRKAVELTRYDLVGKDIAHG